MDAVLIVRYLRWSDLDPSAHPFDPELVRAPLEALVLETSRDRRDHDAVVLAIDQLLFASFGAWAGGWRWAASEPAGGGPVQDWCCSSHSVFRKDDPDALATARRALAALASWRAYLVELAACFAKPVTEEVAQQLGLPKPAGALVTEVKTGSPAAVAGLRTDDVILRWGDRAVDHRDLPWIVAQTPVGKTITLAVWRTRAEVAIKLVTEKMPE